MKKIASPFCPSDSQTIWHLFVSCTQACSFWDRFQNCCTHCLALNQLMLSKYFPYFVKALSNIKQGSDGFVSLVQENRDRKKTLLSRRLKMRKNLKRNGN